MLKVLPRVELGLEDSKSSVITNYTIRPLVYLFIFFYLFFRILLSYFKKPLARLELATPGLEVRCAIHCATRAKKQNLGSYQTPLDHEPNTLPLRYPAIYPKYFSPQGGLEPPTTCYLLSKKNKRHALYRLSYCGFGHREARTPDPQLIRLVL